MKNQRSGSVPMLALASFAFTLGAAGPAIGQSVTIPPNVLIPNNEGLPEGALGGLEGNAFTARVADSTAGWFNPAGLAAASASSASVSAGSFRLVSVTDDASSDSSGSSFRQLPAAVGVLVKAPWGNEKVSLGFTVARTAAWSQATEGQILTPGTLRSYTTLSADSEFNRTTVAISAAWSLGTWRVGGGLLGDIMSLRDVQAVSYRKETGAAILTGLGDFRATGSQATLRLALGAQADLSHTVKLGMVVRTPGVRIFPSGVYAFDVIGQEGAASRQASFFDPEASFQYRLPFEGAVGIAWVTRRFELELDVKGQTAVTAYDGFSSPRSILFVTDPGNGSQPIVTTSPFPARTFEARAIVNFAVGGHLQLDEKGVWKLHAGFSTDRSPVGTGDSFFGRVDLSSLTIGIGGAVKHLAGSLGLTYQWGTTDEMTVPDTIGGSLARTRFNVSNVGILYSVSYVF